jgi:hypothetical protein
LREFRFESLSLSENLHGECHLNCGWSGGVRLSVFRVEFASVSNNLHGECHLNGDVVRWW